MARVITVKAAAKDYPNEGISKGDAYYHWSFRFGGKHRSKTHPKPSQLTQSEFMSEALCIGEEIDECEEKDPAELKSLVEDWVGRIRQIGEDALGAYDNMPEGLQQGDTGLMLENRAEMCEEWAGNLEDIDFDEDPPTDDDEELDENRFLDAVQQYADYEGE